MPSMPNVIRRRFCIVAILALLLAACAPVAPATLDPRAAGAYFDGVVTADAQATAYQETSNEKQFRQSLTATALPPQQTATTQALHLADIAITQAWDDRASTAVAQTVAYTQTQIALARIDSDAQARIADNNRKIADSVHGGELWRNALTWLTWILVLAVGVLAAWCSLQIGMVVVTWRKETRKRIEFDNAMRAYRVTQKEANPNGGNEFLLTSAGPVAKSHAVTLADKHVTAYDRASKWRGMLKAYTARCIELGREGVKHPFSRPTCAEYALLTRPDRSEWWQLGHKRTIDILFTMGILTNDTGQGGEVVLAIDSGSVARVIDTTPLPKLPPDPIPVAKITLATYQV